MPVCMYTHPYRATEGEISLKEQQTVAEAAESSTVQIFCQSSRDQTNGLGSKATAYDEDDDEKDQIVQSIIKDGHNGNFSEDLTAIVSMTVTVDTISVPKISQTNDESTEQ